jgi:chitinase
MRYSSLLSIFLFLGGPGVTGQTAAASEFEVIAYYSGNGENMEAYSIGKLTQIIFSFLHLKNDTLHFASSEKMEALRKVVSLKKKYPKLKVLVALGGWGGCATCSEVFSKPEGRKNFAQSAARVIKDYEVDGIDLDWEYPAIQGPPGHAYKAEDKDNFTDLIIKIRKAIGPNSELSFAAGGFTQYLEESVDWKAVMPHLNRVNLMTYDLVGGYSTQTGHHTALYSSAGQKESTDNCVQWLLKNDIPAEKLIIGAAFYARIWENVSNVDWGLYKKGTFKQSLGYKNFDQLEPDSGWVHHWDENVYAPYAYHKTKNLFATYDNGMSLFEKVNYARQHKLGGIMFWELLSDKPGDGLLDVLADAVAKTKLP